MGRSFRHNNLFLLSFVIPIAAIVFLIGLFGRGAIYAGSVRGVSGDLWADTELGRRDFTEISARGIVAFKVNNPGGTIVDRSVTPGRLYVWDSGNNRILGVDLSKCYSSTSACSAAIVLGQSSLNDRGACNRDSSFSNYPNRIAASANTLCGISEKTHTVLEDKTFTSMYVDSKGALYVADSFNHRVLKYASPFTTQTASDVWGQTSFSGNGCNITGGIGAGFNGPAPAPTASSLCFHTINSTGSGVTIDSTGNMWVADGGNNRVLRFPFNSSTGTIAKTADVVLGQSDFTTGGDNSGGSALNRMSSPTAVRVDAQGIVWVVDSGNNRILRFMPPFTNGMAAQLTFAGNFNSPQSLEFDPSGNGVFVFDSQNGNGRISLWSNDGLMLETQMILPVGGGSFGIDTNGNILPSSYVGEDVYRYTKQSSGNYLSSKNLFSPPFGYNQTAANRFEAPGWGGVGIAGTQVIASDGRLLFWNNLSTLSNGKTPDGYVGGSSLTDIPNPAFEQIQVDADKRVWVTKTTSILEYQGPLTTGEQPSVTLTSPLNVLGGGQLTFNQIHGVAVTPHSEFIWVSDADESRVFRVRNPLTNPQVDVILGQTSLTGTLCNRGLVPQPNTGTTQDADLTMLCNPGALAIDRQGNLYVSDHYLESEGNWRLLMFGASSIPTNNTSVIFDPVATKSFPRQSATNQYAHATFQPAFDSKNRMVVGYNPYLGPRFPEYYVNPTRVNPSNPSDPAYAVPNGHLNDLYSWPVAATFDANDNLYMYDMNRGQLRIYKKPLAVSPSVKVTNPTNGSTVSVNSNVNITATASDNFGISSLTFTVNGNLLCTDFGSFTCPWTVPSATGKTYTISAKATDSLGNTSTSTVKVTSR